MYCVCSLYPLFSLCAFYISLSGKRRKNQPKTTPHTQKKKKKKIIQNMYPTPCPIGPHPTLPVPRHPNDHTLHSHPLHTPQNYTLQSYAFHTSTGLLHTLPCPIHTLHSTSHTPTDFNFKKVENHSRSLFLCIFLFSFHFLYQSKKGGKSPRFVIKKL